MNYLDLVKLYEKRVADIDIKPNFNISGTDASIALLNAIGKPELETLFECGTSRGLLELFEDGHLNNLPPEAIMIFLHMVKMCRWHDYCNNNRKSILEGHGYVCFFCFDVFDNRIRPIKEWTDSGQSAICPACGVDSIIALKDVPDIENIRNLKAMETFWFGEQTIPSPAIKAAVQSVLIPFPSRL
jgi:hypothetical protein